MSFCLTHGLLSEWLLSGTSILNGYFLIIASLSTGWTYPLLCLLPFAADVVWCGYGILELKTRP